MDKKTTLFVVLGLIAVGGSVYVLNQLKKPSK